MTEKTTIPSWVKKSIIFFWGSGALLWTVYRTAGQVRSILIQLLLALFLSFAMEPAVAKLMKRGLKRGAATGITMAGVLAFILAFLAAMGSLISTQLTQLSKDLPNYIEDANVWLNNNFDLEIDSQRIRDAFQEGNVNQYVTTLADNILSISTLAVGILFQVLTVSLFAFYFSADGPKLRQFICSLLPPAKQSELLRVWELAINKTGAYISSRFILAIASSAFHWIVFAALGVPSSLALALWVGLISQFVPIIGTYIAGVFPLLVALGNDPVDAIWIIGAVLIYQQVENYILQPRITAQTLDMHPAIAFGAVLAGGSLLGATGAVLAIPLTATIQSFAAAYVERHSVVGQDNHDDNTAEVLPDIVAELPEV